MEMGSLAGLFFGFQQVRGPRCYLTSPIVFLCNFRDALALIAQAQASQALLREKLSQ